MHVGKYDPNQYLVLARYVVSPSQRTLLTLHAEVSNGWAPPPPPNPAHMACVADTIAS